MKADCTLTTRKNGFRCFPITRKDAIILLCKLQKKELKEDITTKEETQLINWLIDQLQQIKRSFA